jgi:GTP diphosphokinase / guanosine-3',5'-bis(diphosphate) 3'-diphosphatase
MRDPQLDEIIKLVSSYSKGVDLSIIEQAFQFAKYQHKDQFRATGEPYFIHLVETAKIACSLKLDVNAIAAALLHDTIEDCPVTEQDLAQEFNDEIASLVEGVTKLTIIEYTNKNVKQAENLRKMLLATGKDLRVVLLKLCDRLHNMRTMELIPLHKKQKKAQETKDFYMPIAYRLGLFPICTELNLLCFEILEPENYSKVVNFINTSDLALHELVTQVKKVFIDALDEAKVEAEVIPINLNPVEVWREANESISYLSELSQLFEVKIIVNKEKFCYDALGVLHGNFCPVPNKFNDYIARPKSNMYRALHTTLVYSRGSRVAVQIQSKDMERIGKSGVLEYWYSNSGASREQFNLNWMNNFIESQEDLINPDELLDSIRAELYPYEIVALSSKGDPIVLPKNATPLDFAYAVSPKLAHRTSATLVNGRQVPLNYRLRNGDTVELVTSKQQSPNPEWLNHVNLAKAKRQIKNFLFQEELSRQTTLGREILANSLSPEGLILEAFEKDGRLLSCCLDMGLSGIDSLYQKLAKGIVKINDVLSCLSPQIACPSNFQEKMQTGDIVGERFWSSYFDHGGSGRPIYIASMCCDPIYGQEVVGVVAPSGAIEVHAADCPQIESIRNQVRPVEWVLGVNSLHKVRLDIETYDRIGMLKDLVSAISELGLNIAQAFVDTANSELKAYFQIDILVNNFLQYNELLKVINNISEVLKVSRSAVPHP